MKVSKELADVLRQASAEVDAWPKWKRSLDPIGDSRQSQRDDWQALVDYLSPRGNGACLNALLEDGPDDKTDFAGLLKKFKEQDGVKA